MAKMKISLKNNDEKTLARTYIIDGKWLYIGYNEKMVDTLEEAFSYESCSDAHEAHYYDILKEEIDESISEIMTAYEQGEEEYIFYL